MNSLPHFGKGGIRKHSVGEHYPLTVSVRENRRKDEGECYVWNMQTGQKLASFPFKVSDRQTFSHANSAAEQALGQLSRDPSKPIQLRGMTNPPEFNQPAQTESEPSEASRV